MEATAPNQRPDARDSYADTAQSPAERVKRRTIGSKSHRRVKTRVAGELSAQAQPCSSSSSSYSTMCVQSSSQRGFRVAPKRRNPRLSDRHAASDVEAIAFPLGMSFAAVVAQVLERTDANSEKMPVDHLSKFWIDNAATWAVMKLWINLMLTMLMICVSAVRESLANVFGDKFEPFARNFEKAFGSTLNTLRLVNGSSIVENPQDHQGHFRLKDNGSEMITAADECSSRNFDNNDCQKDLRKLGGDDCQKDARKFDANNCPAEPILPASVAQEDLNNVEEIQGNQPKEFITQELSLHQELSCVSSNVEGYSRNNSTISVIEKSLAEQTRANNLKAFEISLAMKKLRLKEAQLALNSDSNSLERCKLSMGISKTSFKVEKFKTQMEDTRHAELLRNCIDCLVAGLFIMSALIIYGAYVYSYKRIAEATSSCIPIMESKSWWIPKPMSSLNSGFHTLRCQVQVISRMLFGVLMILAIGYSIFQRAGTPRQTMPVTFILLMLGVGCGIVGKFCMDTLGGSGYLWLLYWEALCALHFFANMFTPFFFAILYGPVDVAQTKRGSAVVLPYWMRRVVFYVVILVMLPVLSGLLPFAGVGEWKDHFSSLFSNLMLAADEGLD